MSDMEKQAIGLNHPENQPTSETSVPRKEQTTENDNTQKDAEGDDKIIDLTDESEDANLEPKGDESVNTSSQEREQKKSNGKRSFGESKQEDDDQGLKQTTLDGVITFDKEDHHKAGDVKDNAMKESSEIVPNENRDAPKETASGEEKEKKVSIDDKEPVPKKAKTENGNNDSHLTADDNSITSSHSKSSTGNQPTLTESTLKSENSKPSSSPSSKIITKTGSTTDPSPPTTTSSNRKELASSTNETSNPATNLTSEPTTNPGDSNHLDHPENWTTGNDPATDKQIGFIKVLEKQKGVDVGVDEEHLGKSEASEIIGELKGK